MMSNYTTTPRGISTAPQYLDKHLVQNTNCLFRLCNLLPVRVLDLHTLWRTHTVMI